MRRAVLIGGTLLCALPVLTLAAESNFDPGHSRISLESVGMLDWSADLENGAVINQYYASGFLYGANIGWIHLGTAPANRYQYRNDSATDFGVNVTADGSLRGFAYGANIGWIRFEATGNPRVDWNSGRLHGRAWSANLGWIDLENGTEFLQLAAMPEAADADGDGIADAWEIFHASNLTSFSADSDADGDGLSDVAEYVAGTDPLDPADNLQLKLNASSDATGSVLQWPTKAGYVYLVEERAALLSSANWSPVGERIVGSGEVASVTVPAANNYSFYRVRAYLPLSVP